MRYVILGAGAIGGTIAAGLVDAGAEVTAVARGGHLAAIRRDGLVVRSPEGERTVRIEVAASAADLHVGGGDAVVLAVKSQDTEAALRALAGADPQTAIVCAQNGVANESMALRLFRNVYGMCVWMPSDHVEPGVVSVYATSPAGVLDLGRFPSGTDAVAEEMAADLRRAGFDSRAVADVMRWKYRKLLGNLANAVQAILGVDVDDGGIGGRAQAEALACYAAAGIEPVAEDDLRARVAAVSHRPAAGGRRRGGSSWQSMIRGTGTIESDFLNGEIVLLGRSHGVPAPINEALARTAAELARRGGRPGEIGLAELERRIAACSHP